MNTRNLLKRVRIHCGLTQVELGKVLRVTSMTISNWESGRARPVKFTAAVLMAMATYTGDRSLLKRHVNTPSNAKANIRACAHLLRVLFGAAA